ncbi:hypothetical protein G7Y89_g10336 [Cudoniella acicularis]|uniref:Uncharacterized protein n=1 Tax=Cudoniella acicularis TaxID=354080 RepID=A0A8H4RFR3_9HELO|nr:hypothetical protein G7Y89_g10336 [Cudoniella acicularis]
MPESRPALNFFWMTQKSITVEALSRSSPPRFFSSAHILSAAKPKHIKPASKSISKDIIAPVISKSTNTPIANYKSLAATLAQKSHITPLYEAPSHTMFMWTSYGAAFFFFTYASYALYTYNAPPIGVPYWVPWVFGGVGFLMVFGAGFFVLGPVKLIRSISAVPRNVLLLSKNPAEVAAAAKAPELQLEVELRKMLPIPFFPARKVYVEPHNFILTHTLAAPTPVLRRAELMALQIHQEEEARKALEYERSHLLSAPFRHASKAFFTFFRASRRAWTREGFTYVKINNKVYKLDASGGWALDNGRALDKH